MTGFIIVGVIWIAAVIYSLCVVSGREARREEREAAELGEDVEE